MKTNTMFVFKVSYILVTCIDKTALEYVPEDFVLIPAFTSSEAYDLALATVKARAASSAAEVPNESIMVYIISVKLDEEATAKQEMLFSHYTGLRRFSLVSEIIYYALLVWFVMLTSFDWFKDCDLKSKILVCAMSAFAILVCYFGRKSVLKEIKK
jgi:hypothetical protein